tara:strand:- start:413 stop:2110 length:1698 start_codon:yes stop_codon:yes gene_type:complete
MDSVSTGGRIFGLIFFTIFGGFALVFMGVGAFITWESAKPSFWTEVPCEFETLEVTREAKHKRKDPYSITAKYSYEFRGNTFVSEKIGPNTKRYDDIAEANRVVEAYRTNAICRVNPNDPKEAVLQAGSWTPAIFMIFPIPFLAIGVFGIIGVLKKGRGKAAPRTESATGKNSKSGGCALIGFGSIFFLAGLGFLFFFVKPVIQAVTSSDWKETPCVIQMSEVRSQRGSDSTTYSVAVEYSYTVKGKEYRSSRYRFMKISSSGRSGKREIVKGLPAGKETVCYVDPDDPTEAVLNRKLGWDTLFAGIPLIFVVIGGGIIYTGIRGGIKSTGGPASARTPAAPRGISFHRETQAAPMSAASGSVELKSQSRIGKAIVIFCIAAFWNGITSIFVVQVVKAWQRDRGSWFETLFMVPFVLIGLGLFIAFIYNILTIFNPRAKLTLTRSQLAPGETVGIKWVISGSVNRLQSLEIVLEGIEEATYRRGTRTHTDSHTFASIPVYTSNTTPRTGEGNVSFQVPDGAMHTFTGCSNRIHWQIQVKGDIPFWPDLGDTYDVEMLPQAVSLHS